MAHSLLSLIIAVLYASTVVFSQDEDCSSPLMAGYRSRLQLQDSRNCQVLQDERCAKYGYPATTRNNFLNHHSQHEAGRQQRNFDQLIMSNCSAELEFLLCTFHFPICLSGLTPVQPCRGICSRVRHSCAPVLERQGYAWPSAMHCENLPVQSAICSGRTQACVNEVAPIVRHAGAGNPSVGRAVFNEDGQIVPDTVQAPPQPKSERPALAARADLPSLEKCERKCNRSSVSQAQPDGTVWAFIGKVRNVVRHESGKMFYKIKVYRPLRVISRDIDVVKQLQRGQVITVAVRARRSGCACPMLKLRSRYIFTGRVGGKSELRMRQGDAAVPYLGKKHNLTKILPKWLRYWMGIA